MRRGIFHHSAETRERTRASHVARREQTSIATRAAMAAPEVRCKISEATKRGMARWREAKLQALRNAWRQADKRVRAAFLAEHFAQVAVSVTAEPDSGADE